MKEKLKGFAEAWSKVKGNETPFTQGMVAGMHACARQVLEILDAEGDSGAVGEEVVNRVAKAIADAAGHGMREKCEHMAHAAISAYRLATWPENHPARSGVVRDEDVRDAARYRWLRDFAGDSFSGPYIAGRRGAPFAGDGWITGESADQAIDDAIQGERHE